MTLKPIGFDAKIMEIQIKQNRPNGDITFRSNLQRKKLVAVKRNAQRSEER
jgi:hypothetical protein